MTTPHPAITDALIRIMEQIDPAARSGAPIGIRELRRHYTGSREGFAELILSHSRAGIIALHHHDFPAELTPEQLDELLCVDGTYYICCALR